MRDSRLQVESFFRRILFARVPPYLVLGAALVVPVLAQQAAPQTFRITPQRPIAELRQEALAARPPVETGDFRRSDLVELARLDPTIKLDIRYATSNNFLGTPVYRQARAFLQRPAAMALLRASRALHTRGYGVLVFDGYRPWYVTKIFWDATPADKKTFLANPANGSRHNRGCAVDLTLYSLGSGRPVTMPSGYDEMTARAAADYAGGTESERQHRRILRRAMETEGFVIEPSEWWHYDYRDWKQFRLGNVPFERIGR